MRKKSEPMLPELIDQIKYDPASRHTKSRVVKAFGLAFEKGWEKEWNKVMDVSSQAYVPDDAVLSVSEVMDMALASNRLDAVQWTLKQYPCNEDGESSGYGDLQRKFASRLSSHVKAPLRFVVDILQSYPGLLDGQSVVYSTCLNSLMSEAIASPAHVDFEILSNCLVKTCRSPSESALEGWLLMFARRCSVNEAKQLLLAIDQSTDVESSIDKCFPVVTHTTILPGGGPFPGYLIPSIQINSVSQLLGWSGGPSMSFGMSHTEAKKVWIDPELFKAWLPIAAHQPSQLAKLIPANKDLQSALLRFRDDEGRNSIHLIAHIRLNNSLKKFNLLEGQIIKHLPSLFSDPSTSSDAISIPDLLSEYFPSWSSSWRRSILKAQAGAVGRAPKAPFTPKI